MKHRRTEIVQQSTARWVCRCTCGHQTPSVESKRTAVQAHLIHARDPDA